MSRIDLHTHSHYSDGTTAPAEVVRRAYEAGVRVLVLTDHDNISGVAEAGEAGAALGMKVLPGVEINTCEHDHLHILGYHVDIENPKLRAHMEDFQQRRRQRIRSIVERLQGQRIDISHEDVQCPCGRSVGRPHVADAMMRKGIVRSRKAAFDRYLMPGKPGYAPPLGPTPEEAIAVIREAGGWASMAHPGDVGDWSRLEQLVDCGLRGVEAYYPTHSARTVQSLLSFAREHGLQPTVGSDYHGPGTSKSRIAVLDVGDGIFDDLVKRL